MTVRVELAVNYLVADEHPSEWARHREDQGWDVLAVADHLFTDYRPPFPHLWVAATAIACATSRVTVASAFANNMLRHPVEVAQAALQLQQVSGGRFELGIGAGWFRPEIEAIGGRFPTAGERAGSYAEAAAIVASLLRTGGCRFDGDHYRVAVERLGPAVERPPALVGSVGGPRTIAEVTPFLDRVEIKASSPSTRDGGLDWAALAKVSEADLVTLRERVRAVRPDVPIDLFVLCNTIDDARTRELSTLLAGGLYGRFFGPPDQVAAAIADLGSLGISRAQLSPLDPDSLDQLARQFFG